MKKILNFAFIAILALGVVSCSKDGMIDEGNSLNSNAKTITFTIPASGGVVTYADPDPAGTVTANAAEKALDMSTLSVYMFDAATSKLQAVFSGSQIKQGTSGSSTTAVISLNESWASYSADKHFYLVANTAAGSELAGVVADAALGATATLLTDFLALATDAQSAHLMPVSGTASSYLMMTEKVENVSLESTTQVEVYFRRNVARFDIENDVNAYGVEIEAIKVYKANLQGFVFGYEHRPALMTSPATGDLDAVDVAAPVNDMQEEASLFYLYPTVVKADGTGTVINLIGNVGGVSKVFSIQSTTDITIEANRRYKISAMDSEKLTFVLEVADWDDETVGMIGKQDKSSTYGSYLAGSANVVSGGSFYEIGKTFIASTGAVEFTFGVMSSSTDGSTFSSVVSTAGTGLVDYSSKINVDLVGTDNVITYATPYYLSTFKVTMDASAVVDAESFHATIMIKDENTGNVSGDVKLFHQSTAPGAEIIYPESGLAAVKVGDVIWAPTNVGASIIDENGVINTQTGGVLFQWGRDIPFSIERQPLLIKGAVSYGQAMGEYMNYFIVTNHTPWVTGSDILTSWNNNKGPCPEGWRLPNSGEVVKIFTPASVQGRTLDTSKNRLILSSDDAQAYLIFPAAKRIGVDGYLLANQGHYWSSGLSSETIFKSRGYFEMGSGIIDYNSPSIAFGASVRCVKE